MNAIYRRRTTTSIDFSTASGRNLDGAAVDRLYFIRRSDVIVRAFDVPPSYFCKLSHRQSGDCILKFNSVAPEQHGRELPDLADAILPAPRPHLKMERIELAIQMTTGLIPAAGALKAQDLSDAAMVPELEKEGRCNF